jgi:hypothetical protein
MEYKGYKTILADDAELSKIYVGQYDTKELKENEYLIVEDNDHNPVDYFQLRDGILTPVKYPVIESNFAGQVKPRNPQQYCAMDLLKNNIKSQPRAKLMRKLGK